MGEASGKQQPAVGRDHLPVRIDEDEPEDAEEEQSPDAGADQREQCAAERREQIAPHPFARAGRSRPARALPVWGQHDPALLWEGHLGHAQSPPYTWCAVMRALKKFITAEIRNEISM